MKNKCPLTSFLLLSVVFSALFISTAASAERTLVFPTDPWPPFMLGMEGSESTEGTGVDLMKAIFDRIEGVNVSIPLVPWNRALNLVAQGKSDAIPLLYKTAERELVMDFSAPLFPSQDLAWYSKSYFPNGLEWQVVNDFKPYSVGIVNGYNYSEEIDQAISNKKIKAVKAKNVKQLLVMLAGGRIDVAIANKVVGAILIKKNFKNRNIVSMLKPIAEDNYHMAFSKKTSAKDLLPKINQVIAELKKEGAIEKIIYGE
jgi:polar amino acid transport system substrate-binding protein